MAEFFKNPIIRLLTTIFTIIGHVAWMGVLTLFTQVGGLLWLLCLPFFPKIKRRFPNFFQRQFFKLGLFSVVYLLCWALVIPPLAKWQCGRVPLPVWSNPHLKPASVLYFCLSNHHYVRPEVKASAENAAHRLAEKHPGAAICYMDANFPFIDGYPLEPHFSHRDGKKLDVALHWVDRKTNLPIFGTPKPLGYGAFELPLPGEPDKDDDCRKSRWRNFDFNRFGSYDKKDFRFDVERTADMIRFFAEEKAVNMILLEPHLKQRLGLGKYGKIRFQGCKAARHDDHIHVQ